MRKVSIIADSTCDLSKELPKPSAISISEATKVLEMALESAREVICFCGRFQKSVYRHRAVVF